MKKITLVIPAKNEILSLRQVLNEVKNFEFISQIIVIVDSQNDNSIGIAKEFGCTIIIQNKKGYGSAIIEGFKNAKTDFACIFNADYSFDPSYLEEMVFKSNTYDFIFGSRYGNKGSSEDDDIITLIGNYIFTFMSKYILKINLSDILYTFVLCNVAKFNSIEFKKKDFRFCIELPHQVNLNNFTYTEIYMNERRRYAGNKNVNVLKDGFLILLEIIYSFFKKK